MSLSAGIGHVGFVLGQRIEQRYEEAKKKAHEETSDYLKGYLEGWESRTGPVKKFFYKLFDAAPEVKAFKEELSGREELTDRL